MIIMMIIMINKNVHNDDLNYYLNRDHLKVLMTTVIN